MCGIVGYAGNQHMEQPKAVHDTIHSRLRDGQVVLEGMEEKALQVADNCVCVPRVHPMFQPSLSLVPLQVFAYYVAICRGCDVDKPRNLAKSVTVE